MGGVCYSFNLFILRYYGIDYPFSELERESHFNKEGPAKFASILF